MPRRVRDGRCDHVQGAVCCERLMTGTEGELPRFLRCCGGLTQRCAAAPREPRLRTGAHRPRGMQTLLDFKQSFWEGGVPLLVILATECNCEIPLRFCS